MQGVVCPKNGVHNPCTKRAPPVHPLFGFWGEVNEAITGLVLTRIGVIVGVILIVRFAKRQHFVLNHFATF